MKFENTEVWGFEHALRGMRNPYNSWDKSDSDCLFHMLPNFSEDDPNASNYEDWMDKFGFNYKIGEKDLELAQKLIKAGSEHRKFLRQIFVSVDIIAPLYWWKEFDTYKVGTVSNSCSTMHTLINEPIKKYCFEMDDYEEFCDPFKVIDNCPDEDGIDFQWNYLLCYLEALRLAYLKTKEKKYWKELIRLLPESYLQRRTITMSYENILSMVKQRRNHKLIEWSVAFILWAKSLPYADKLIFIGEE